MTDSSELSKTDNSSFLTNTDAFEHTWRVATAFSKSTMVPPQFQQKPEDCMVALLLAQQLEVNPLLALQNVQVIHGRPGFSASFAIALANQRGPFIGPITWTTKGKGDALEVTAKATVKSTKEVVTNTVTMAIAKAEGWTKNSKYKTMPEQMLRYRSATWLIRSHCPEVLLGFDSAEEIQDVGMKTIQVIEQEDDVVSQMNKTLLEGSKVIEDNIKKDLKQQEELKTDLEIISDNDPEDPFS